MLQVKNLTKIYNANGVAVKALDDVSLSFGDSGMCFVLGKSGSGKSTFLNVCGGLDAPDSGEIIVKNRSSKDFTAKDFDSYRNTFIGFIFQEYNVLNEFSVEDNVMLALELQGKKKDKAVVDSILEKVDLKGLNKRKPNTLSGGQKQRVAIARALVKNPEIIMADEPSGALDSETGKQVFDTLKKLSRDKLVLVVSHDREFAEKYADRIIELKDGKVLSDVTKQVCEADEKENVSCINSNTLLVKRGRKLTEEDIEKIRHVVENSNTDVLITSDEKGVDEYKKNNDVTDASNGSFVETIQPQQRKYTDEESTFIRSTLPMRHAVRVGASGIKLKPVRFAFTLLLSIISFVMFGMLSCLMFYDSATVTANSLYDYGWDYIGFNHAYVLHVNEYNAENDYMLENIEKRIIPISDKYVSKYTETFGDVVRITGISSATIYNFDPQSKIYQSEITGWADGDSVKYIYGSAPKGNNQVAISQYLYEGLLAGKLNLPSGTQVNDYRDIVLNLAKVGMGSETYSVSGVFQCDDVYKQWQEWNLPTDKQLSIIRSSVADGFLNYVAIDMDSYDHFFVAYGGTRGNKPPLDTVSMNYSDVVELELMGQTELVGHVSRLNDSIRVYDFYGNQVKSVEDCVVVSLSTLEHLVINELVSTFDDMAYSDKEFHDKYYTKIFNNVSYATLDREMSQAERNGNIDYYLQCYKYLIEFAQENAPELIDFSSTSVIYKGNELAKNAYFSPDVTWIAVMEDQYRFFEDIIKKGSSWSEELSNYTDNFLDAKYMKLFVPSGNPENVKSLVVNEKNFNSEDSSYIISNFIKTEIESLSETVSILSKVFLWAGIVMAVFSMLLLFNFITASIHAKRKEIGILRALGASGGDVFKIFMSESAIVVIICSIVSVILTGVISSAVNASVSAQFGIPFSMFTFGIVSVAMIFGIAVVTAVISTFLPVWKNARKRPVEAIRQL